METSYINCCKLGYPLTLQELYSFSAPIIQMIHGILDSLSPTCIFNGHLDLSTEYECHYQVA